MSENNGYIVREAIRDDLDSIRVLAEVIEEINISYTWAKCDCLVWHYDFFFSFQKAAITQNIRISKYKKPNFDEISVINVDGK